LGLDVLHQIGSTSFRYIDKISQLALDAYQIERDHWLANQNRVRAMRVHEVLHADDIDVDETSTAIRYPLRRTHLSLIVWCSESDDDDELAAMERFVGELGKSLGAQERPLFIAADRVTGWAWIPLSSDAGPNVVAQVRAFTEAQVGAPWIAVGHPLPGIDGFRRSHQQAVVTRGAVIAAGPRPPRVTAASDPGIAVIAQFSGDLRAARAWVSEVLGPLASATTLTNDYAKRFGCSCGRGRASRPPQTNSIFIPTR
jgi:DNA-binding PucR family transcriptional regulator